MALVTTPTVTGLPASYDIRTAYAAPEKWFLNNRYGCCVISARADLTMFLEKAEQGTAVIPTDNEVKAQYFLETGGRDKGLSLLGSVGVWKSVGWMVGGKRLKIKSYKSIPKANTSLIKQAIVSSFGLLGGMYLPLSASDQMRTNAVWTVTTGARSKANSWGPHVVHLSAFTPTLLGCDTWARRIWMTWAFWAKYSAAACSVVDAVNP